MRVKACLLFMCFFIFSQGIFIDQVSASNDVVMYGDTDCGKCLSYIAELQWALGEIGITDIQIRDFKVSPEARVELHELNNRLEVPFSMRGNVAVVIEGRYVFEGYVPVSVIKDFIMTNKGDYQRFVLYRDDNRNLYMLMDEKGEIRECPIIDSIQKCLSKTDFRLGSLPLLPLIVVSGLIDGVNPCAFAVLIFFLDFLFTISKHSSQSEVKRRVLTIGSVYIASIYLAYLLIGVGLLKAFTILPFPNLIAQLGAILVIMLGVINIKDYFFYGRWFSLKIPSRQGQLITRVIRKATIPSICLVGFLVALFEFPCTGGIYVAIIGMLAVKTVQIQALIYLLIYNVAFVLPLMIILAFASNKQIIDRMNGWQKGKKKYMRLLLGLFMVFLGILLLLW